MSQCKEDWKVCEWNRVSSWDSKSQCKEDWKTGYVAFAFIVTVCCLNAKRIERMKSHCGMRPWHSVSMQRGLKAGIFIGFLAPFSVCLNAKRIESYIEQSNDNANWDGLNAKRIESFYGKSPHQKIKKKSQCKEDWKNERRGYSPSYKLMSQCKEDWKIIRVAYHKNRST